MSFDSKPKYEIKPSSGRAFKNDRAREGGKDAHFNGTFVDENGVEHFLDIWVNAKDENVQERLVNAIKYLNIRTKKKDKQPGAGRPLAPTQGSFPDTGRYDPVPERASKPTGDRPRTTMDDIDDSIPF
jgi:hypothetical protein